MCFTKNAWLSSIAGSIAASQMWITSICQRMSKRSNNRRGMRDEYCLNFIYLTVANTLQYAQQNSPDAY